MGLDGVELVMAVEEAFKIAIPDADAAQCVTVGRLVDLVDARLRHDATDPCPSQHGFYVVRKELTRLLRLNRAAIKPGTRLADLILREHRRTIWPDLVCTLTDGRTKRPGLVRPMWGTLLVRLVLPVAIGGGPALFTAWSLSAAITVALVVAVLGDRLTAALKREFPPGFSQVQDLIRFVSTLDAGTWSKDDVFRKLRAIIVERLAVDESEVTLEAEFVKDLGVD
jgi:acyl carrier protein